MALPLHRLPAALMPRLRRLLLAQARRMAPAALLRRAEAQALAVARAAAARSPGYRTLLAEHGLQPAALQGPLPLQALPVLDKHNSFGRFDLPTWSGGLQPRQLADVLTSSGRGGQVFGLRLATRAAMDSAWFDIDLGLQDSFDVDRVPTLLVNCLPMGVVFSSRAVTVANVSVREDMACAVLQQAGPAFGQTIVCTDPLFVNRLLRHAAERGIDWSRLNTSLVLGEETLVEAQRSHLEGRLGMAADAPGPRLVGSSFGVGELGLNLLFETRETIAMRRALQASPAHAALLGARAGAAVPSLFCFNPLRTHVEVLQPGADGFGSLCLTLLDTRAVLLLPRYTTGDSARLLLGQEARAIAAACGLPLPWLPMVALQGRAADRDTQGLAVEDIKQALYADPLLADQLTGAFLVRRDAARGARWLRLLAHGRPEQQVAQLRVPALQQRLAAMDLACEPPWEVQVLEPDAWPQRPPIDHERKFRYVET